MNRSIALAVPFLWCGVLFADGTTPPPATGLTCTADGAKVTLTWTAPANVTVQDFVVYRNWQKIATLDATVLTYVDQVTKVGKYEYTVVGDTGKKGMWHRFPSWSCAVAIDCFGLEATVTGMSVALTWTAVTPADPTKAVTYTVLRDGKSVGTSTTASFTDTVTEAGHYTYEVQADTADPAVLVAACKVTVPPGDIAPPTDFTCAATTVTPEKSGLPATAVALTWKNGQDYVTVQVTLDGKPEARLPGAAQAFTDRDVQPGKHTYQVLGVIKGGWKSAAASCDVEIAEPPPPVTDLVCAMKENTTDTVDLTWTIPADAGYKSVIFRNGTKLTELTTDPLPSTYEDTGLKTGTYTYSVVGVGASASSKAVKCKVKVTVPAAPAKFIRGDADGNGKVDVSDVLQILNYLYPKMAAKPGCLEALDVDNSGKINVVDAINLLMTLYMNGPPPPAPYPDCGDAPAPLGCDDPGSCK